MNSSDGNVSYMLMGFVERKISPQTIADVLRAQIFESQISIQLIDSATCNGILEAITLSSSVEECADLVLYLSTHPNFSENLSFKAAAGSLCVLLKSLEHNTEQKILDLIENLSAHILNIFYTNSQINHQETQNYLSQYLKNFMSTLLLDKDNFKKLRLVFLNTNKDNFDTVIKGILPKPFEMLSTLQKTAPDQLLRNGIDTYKTESAEKYSSGRLKYLPSVLETLLINSASDAKIIFLVEWIFTNSLFEAMHNENSSFEFTIALKHVFENYSAQSCIIKGLINAIQKDYGKINDLAKANRLTAPIFIQFVSLAEKDLNFFTKNIANWALEISLQNEQLRFFTKSSWRFIRTLATKTWDASLREPPAWINNSGSLYCAQIFHIAPALWLQEYAHLLIEQVYHETLVERFHPTPEHYNYIEYLIRCIRKKSPFYASRTESLFALHLLSRLTSSEEQHYAAAKTRFHTLLPNSTAVQIQLSPELLMWKQILENEENFKNKLGNNPVTRAIAILRQLSNNSTVVYHDKQR